MNLKRSLQAKERWEKFKNTGKYEEVCKKISRGCKGRSAWNKGLYCPELRKPRLGGRGRIAWNKGIPFSEEAKRKMIATKKAQARPSPWKGKLRPEMQGKNNPNWRGGTTINKRHPWFFRSTISPMLRSTYPCTICGNKEDLIVHHKDFDKKNNKMDNFEVLCRKHHTLLHVTINKVKHLSSLFPNLPIHYANGILSDITTEYLKAE